MAETKAKDPTIKDNEVWKDTDIAEVNRKEKIILVIVAQVQTV